MLEWSYITTRIVADEFISDESHNLGNHICSASNNIDSPELFYLNLDVSNIENRIEFFGEKLQELDHLI